MAKYFREAVSVIIIGRTANQNARVPRFLQTDYSLLLLKRSQKSSFLPSSYVFPGGTVEESDFSKAWLEVFEKYGYSASDFRQLRSSLPLPRFYASRQTHPILPEVGFRIGAIRETFEESGVLLADCLPESYREQHDIEWWRKAVNKDASKFLEMFCEIGGCPAVWDLHEWISWLTPSHHKKRRFDTIFFITFMDTMPEIVIDGSEIVDLHVMSPPAILEAWHKLEILLAPPQGYEVSRFLNFQNYENFKRFAIERAKKGLDHYFPVRVNASDGQVGLLPGDDLYPAAPDYKGEQEEIKTESTLEELEKDSIHLNRIEFRGGNALRIVVNIVPKFGHVQPIDFPTVGRKSKL